MTRLHRLAAAFITAAFVAVPSAQTHADLFDPDVPNDIDTIVYLDPGEDPMVHADWLLDKLDVPDGYRGSCGAEPAEPSDRCIWTYEYPNGLWLRLTRSEAEEARRLTYRDGILSIEIAFQIQLAPHGMIGEPLGGPQIDTNGYRRVGAHPGPYGNIDVAVLDTGVDADHDDLNVVGGFDCTYEARIGQRPQDAWRQDWYGHGTFGASIIGALDNTVGLRGIAAGADIWSVPVLGDQGSGSMASLMCGTDWVARHNADNSVRPDDTIEVVNMSLGGDNNPSECNSWDAFHTSVCMLVDSGVVVVVSAGNDGADAIGKSPANYAEAVTVSAISDYDGEPGGLAPPPDNIPAIYRDDNRALFSNFGSVVDLTAPGVYMFGATPFNTYTYAHGTSFSAPTVSGVIAAYESDHPECTGQDAVDAVIDWSSSERWQETNGWNQASDLDQYPEPLVRFGAPAC